MRFFKKIFSKIGKTFKETLTGRDAEDLAKGSSTYEGSTPEKIIPFPTSHEGSTPEKIIPFPTLHEGSTPEKIIPFPTSHEGSTPEKIISFPTSHEGSTPEKIIPFPTSKVSSLQEQEIENRYADIFDSAKENNSTPYDNLEGIMSINNPASSDTKAGKNFVILSSLRSLDVFSSFNLYQARLKPDPNLQPIKASLEVKGNKNISTPFKQTVSNSDKFNKEKIIAEVTANLKDDNGKLSARKRAGIYHLGKGIDAFNKNSTQKGLEELQKMIKNPDSIEPGVMDYVATNPNAVKGVAGGAGLIALTNFLMSDRKGQMTNDELYSQ